VEVVLEVEEGETRTRGSHQSMIAERESNPNLLVAITEEIATQFNIIDVTTLLHPTALPAPHPRLISSCDKTRLALLQLLQLLPLVSSKHTIAMFVFLPLPHLSTSSPASNRRITIFYSTARPN
jgi:hypothetical protein